MSRIKIETLTSVHIGSGETLQPGSDFVKGKLEGEPVLGVVDDRKVLSLIGEQNVDKWVQAIERKEGTDVIVKQFAAKATFESYSKRVVTDWAAINSNETLKEQLHNGMGIPYIPGSSIKGAIRTALLASFVSGVNNKESKIENRGRVSAKAIESELFGKDPYNDLFRFLQVGDAYFDKYMDITAAIRMVNVNERESGKYYDKSKQQVIEVIPDGEESSFQMKINTSLYQKASTVMDGMPTMPKEMMSVGALFALINAYTLKLLEDEVIYWKDRENNDSDGCVSEYLERVGEMICAIKGCTSQKECVLRIGHASGWRFMTGAWAEGLTNFKDVVVPKARPGAHRYTQFDFPKTRRVNDECALLGFVKLTVE